MKLTAKNVRTTTLEKDKSESIIFDDDLPGFGLRLRGGGSRSLIFQYKLGEKQRRMALGKVSAVDFAKVRKTAENLHHRVKLGEDPASDKAVAKAGAAKTFEAVAADFLAEKKKELRPRSYPDVERHLLSHAKPLHRLQVAKIARADVAACLSSVRKNSGAVTSNRVRTSLSTFFSWVVGEGLREDNPVMGTNRSEEKSRDRVLSPDELRLIWTNLEDDDYGAIMRLLMLTGQRAGEIAGLLWPEVDLDKDLISLAGERTKNHRPHAVPLAQPVHDILAARPQRIGTDGKPRELYFGIGDGPFSGWSNSKERLDARIAAAVGKPLAHWTPHDLRRSFATHAADLGIIQPHIIEAILNHVSGHRGGVAGIYNRAAYENEKRTGLALWAEQIIAWVAGRKTNVVPLRSGG